MTTASDTIQHNVVKANIAAATKDLLRDYNYPKITPAEPWIGC